LQYVDSAHVYDNSGHHDAPLSPLFIKSEIEEPQIGGPTHSYQCEHNLLNYPDLNKILRGFCS